MQRKSSSDTNKVHHAPKAPKEQEEKGVETEAVMGKSYGPEV